MLLEVQEHHAYVKFPNAQKSFEYDPLPCDRGLDILKKKNKTINKTEINSAEVNLPFIIL